MASSQSSSATATLHDVPLSVHDPERADLSFPSQTTNVQYAGFTDEYRKVTHDGLIPADLALRPIPTHVTHVPAALGDSEKAVKLHDVQLVTWKEDDPEDPRQWSAAYRWCSLPSSPCSLREC